MRVYLFFICSVLFSAQLFAESERTLADAVKDYKALQSELDKLLKAKIPECPPGTQPDPSKTFCSMKDLCSKQEIRHDQPILYQNAQGEKIVNSVYYDNREKLRACFREKHKSEIKDKTEEMALKLGKIHLNKIITANKKLNQLADKYNEGAKIQKISAEILTMSLEIGMNGDEANWEKVKSKRGTLTNVISRAEKRAKLTLNPEIKSWLVEIQYLKNNHLYIEEVQAMDEALFPEFKNNNPLYDWSLLKEESAAGGKKSLEANRAKLVNQTQNAYGVFKETQEELLKYFEEIKNEGNASKMERIIERVKTIRFNPPRLTKSVESVCASPNAFYDSSDHSFTICPQYLETPKATLMEIMAHEIAHSFDSCYLSGSFHKKSGPQIVEEAPFEIDIKMDSVLGNYKTSIEGESEAMNYGKKLQEKLLYKDNPFSNAISCLQDPKSIGAQPVKENELIEKTKERLKELTRLGKNKPDNQEAKYLNFLISNQKDFFDYHQGCDNSSSLTRSQLQEAFADKIASDLVARKLKGASKATAEKTMLEISLIYDVCTDKTKSDTLIREAAIRENCPDYFENMTAEQKVLKALNMADPDFDEHPESAKRMDKILLAHPQIRKVLNCPLDKGLKYCE